MAAPPAFTRSDLSGGDPVVDMLVHARVRMLFNQSFFGQMVSRLHYVDATSWCPTAATDGARIYYNRDFIKKLSPDALTFLLAHEVMHAVLGHMYRRGNRDPKVWNMACDYVINSMLLSTGFSEMPAGGLLSKKYTDEWGAEEVYDDLIQNSVEVEYNFDEHLDFDGDEGEDEEGSGDREGNGAGEEGQSESDVGGGTAKVRVFGSDGPPKLTKKDLRKIKNDLRAMTIQAALAAEPGDVPAGVKRMISKLLAPQLDWRSLLESTIMSCLKDDTTFMRPSRRSHAVSILTGHLLILPGQKSQEIIDIWAFIDASGSLTDEMLRDFLSELKGIMEAFGDFRLHVVSFDTKVYTVHEFTPENVKDIHEYSPEGGGGTVFECVFDYLRDNEIIPERLVFFTDGLPNRTWGDEEYCDTLFIVHGDPSRKAPFGLTVPYTKKVKQAA